MLGSSWRCSGSPHSSVLRCTNSSLGPLLPAQGNAGRGQEGCAAHIWLCHAHLAASPAAGPRAGSRASGCKPSTAAALGYCFGNLAEQYKSSKTTQGSGFGVFLLACQQAGMCRREAAHFQGLCEQEGQLLEFEAASSTVNLFLLCYL